jgi:hypothetical protein
VKHSVAGPWIPLEGGDGDELNLLRGALLSNRIGGDITAPVDSLHYIKTIENRRVIGLGFCHLNVKVTKATLPHSQGIVYALPMF